jgi:hypothetical protein
MNELKIAAALSLIGSLAVASYAPAQAAPLTSLSAAAGVNQVNIDQANIVPVRWHGYWHGRWGHRWHRGWGWGGAALAGALIGGALAATTPHYYAPYDAYAYAYPEVVYSAPAYAYPYDSYAAVYPAYPGPYVGVNEYWGPTWSFSVGW